MRRTFYTGNLYGFNVILNITRRRTNDENSTTLYGPLFTRLRFTCTVSIYGTRRLDGVTLRTPYNCLLSRMIPTKNKGRTLPPTPTQGFNRHFNDIYEKKANVRAYIVVFRGTLNRLYVEILYGIRANTSMMFLGKGARGFPMDNGVMPLQVAINLRRPIRATINRVGVVRRDTIPIPRSRSIYLRKGLLTIVGLRGFYTKPYYSQ